MGYCMELVGEDFFIEASKKDAALAAIKALATETDKMSGFTSRGGAIIERHFSWVTTENFVNAKTLAQAMQEWQWLADEDADGNITYISFEGEKLGDDGVLFEAIAPFVKDGSYIEMSGEDGCRWMWCFKNGKMTEKTAKFVYDEDEDE
jgi:hypothetical protein